MFSRILLRGIVLSARRTLQLKVDFKASAIFVNYLSIRVGNRGLGAEGLGLKCEHGAIEHFGGGATGRTEAIGDSLLRADWNTLAGAADERAAAVRHYGASPVSGDPTGTANWIYAG